VQCVINVRPTVPDADADNAAGFLGYLYIVSHMESYIAAI